MKKTVAFILMLITVFYSFSFFAFADESTIGYETVLNDSNKDFTQNILDKDILSGETNFSGKRMTRSQYVSKDGTIFSADINAAYNILIKGNPFALYNNNKPKLDTINYDITEL